MEGREGRERRGRMVRGGQGTWAPTGGREVSGWVGAGQGLQVRLSSSLHLPKGSWPKKTESLPLILQTFFSQKVEENGGRMSPGMEGH